MLVLITGGSGSGKSAYAEEYIGFLSEGDAKYYIATMEIFDEEGKVKIQRHQKMRDGKGFLTIEQSKDIEKASAGMTNEKVSKTALLECMSNLVANEMFSEGQPKKCEEVSGKIMQGIKELYNCLDHLVIVTNNVFEDGVVYDETTMEYIEAMGRVNEKLASMADKVIEVVVGIPLIVKEGK